MPKAIQNAEPLMAGDALDIASHFLHSLDSKLRKRNSGWTLFYPPFTVDITGSAGRNKRTAIVNDIDILVNTQNIDQALVNKAVKSLANEVRLFPGLQITSVGWIYKEKLYQIDLIFHNDYDYAHWIRSSPGEYSAFKGVHRNMLLMAIAAALPTTVLEEAPDKTGKMIPVKWQRYSLDLHDGLIKRIQEAKGKKGQPVATKKTISKELISKRPSEIIHFLLGNSAETTSTLSAESIIEIIEGPDFRYPELRGKILKDAAQRMTDDGLELPAQLQHYQVVSLKKAFIK